jgi:very-short-patch-repair endonuclease
MKTPSITILVGIVFILAVLAVLAAKLKPRDSLFAKPWPLEAKRQLSIDFLIINPDTSIVAAVELDDSTHASEKRRQADARKDHALKSGGVPLIRWNAKNLPDRTAILAAIPTVTEARRNS